MYMYLFIYIYVKYVVQGSCSVFKRPHKAPRSRAKTGERCMGEFWGLFLFHLEVKGSLLIKLPISEGGDRSIADLVG